MQSPEKGGAEFSPFGNILPVADRQRRIEGDFQKPASTDIVRLIAVVNTYNSTKVGYHRVGDYQMKASINPT